MGYYIDVGPRVRSSKEQLTNENIMHFQIQNRTYINFTKKKYFFFDRIFRGKNPTKKGLIENKYFQFKLLCILEIKTIDKILYEYKHLSN